jgi:hypothetical protein
MKRNSESQVLVKIKDRKEVNGMKRFVAREVETLKTTAAFYGCWCCVEGCCES